MKIIFIVLICFSMSLFASYSESVNDSKSGLIWQDDEESKTIKLDWDSAKEYCDNITLDDHTDWRLPTIKELLTIADRGVSNPSILKEFENITPHNYWSSSSFVPDEISAWSVNFKYGSSSSPRDKSLESNVRCVRVGQYNSVHFDNLISKVIKHDKESSAENDSYSDSQETFENSKAIKRALGISWGKAVLINVKYDRDKRYFLADLSFEANKNFVQKVSIKVQGRHVRSFQENMNNLQTKSSFYFDGDRVKLNSVKVVYDRVTYPVKFLEDDDRQRVVSSNLSYKLDEDGLKNFYELDNQLKYSKHIAKDSRKWLFVVGIEDYIHTDDIKFAKRSSKMFAETVQKKLGVPAYQSFVMIDSDANYSNVKNNFETMLKRLKKGDTVYFYYNGHGMVAQKKGNEPYLLTSDVEPAYVADDRYFGLRNIYTKLSYSKASKIVAFFDTSFSRSTEDESIIEAKKVAFNNNKMVVLTACEPMQNSNEYKKKAHRLFSYYLIKNIIDGTKHIKGFFKSVQNQTYETSLVEFTKDKPQEATISGNLRLNL